MPNVVSAVTGQLVHAGEALLGTRLQSAENVRLSLTIHLIRTIFYEFSFLTAGCRSDDECPLTEACFDRECQDPCLYEQCGQNAVCSVKVHRSICTCKPNHIGNPYDRCRPYECLIDPDCPTTQKCENEKCVDPCQCARFADCSPRDHRGYCTCFPDYTGDPYGIACTPSKSYKSRIFWFEITYVIFPQSLNQSLKNLDVWQMVIVHLSTLASRASASTHVSTWGHVWEMQTALWRMSCHGG